MATLSSGKLSEQFEDFLKSVVDRKGNAVYRSKISQLVATEGKSLVVDFGDLLRYNNDLANRVLLEPDSSLASFKIAAFETMRSENALYADRVKRELTVRLRGLPDLVPLRKVDTSYIDHMLAVSGMVVRTSELRPMMTEAAWVCPSGHLTYQGQDDLILKRPPKCELCGEAKSFELDRKRCRFIDFQVLRVQELPEELPPGQLPQFFDVNVEGDIVNTARPGDRVVLTGVVRAVPDYTLGQVKTRLFRSQIDCNHVEVKGKEPEQVLVSKEDEELIRKVAATPDAYERLVNSIAPVILGHQQEKEAILLLLAGGSATLLPDGTKLRGDINALFVGDPGCLVADERIVLGDGGIAKIGEIGDTHLQPLNLEVLTGEGQGERAVATRFHIYRNQPILEIVTESGKSVKGTHNHPLLVLDDSGGKQVRRWRRLDELKVGDRIAAVTELPCTITRNIQTGFKLAHHQKGPRFEGRLPAVVDEDLAGYLGYLLGNGFVDESSAVASVAETEIDVLPKLKEVITRLFATTPKAVRRTTTGRRVRMTDICVDSECIAINLAFLRERRVPRLILLSGNKVVAQFLKWLFEAGGMIRQKGEGRSGIYLKGDNIELLRDVQVLLLRWGIYSRVGRNALVISRGEDAVKYWQHIGFVSRNKTTRLETLAAASRRIGKAHKQMTERVVAIHVSPPEDVYDIEVPAGHRFIANGLVSHNTGKSELLKFASQVAPRGLYASGRGTTAAGLSAAVIREKNVLMLEAGVVVLADLGIAAIDEFEKMKPEDRTALHEMMEQQTVTIAKGGIYATLNARTAILAACNPVLGRYNPFQNLIENIGTLPIPLLTRFDVIFVFRDQPTPSDDEKLANHILSVHARRSYTAPPPIEFSLLKKYLTFAKRISPTLSKAAMDRIKEYYLELRKSSGAEDSIPPTLRTLEALIRISTARAKVLLRDEVTEEDALSAIALMNRMVEDILTDAATKKTDFGIQLGKPAGETKNLRSALEVLKRLEGPEKKPVERKLFKEELVKAKFTDEDAEKMIRTMFREGMVYESKPGYIRRLGS
ncbi:MAG: ATP-binding protein [Nitrososphaerota archaeon]|nr:ATP-binding protein [Nitrososphaerota archaeon]MDG6942252.1 ATP-binding protein [Nitrososphaerota archaeon]MDG6942717.1 ATP-binding protein [Nitrososphaerota archaeon]MDG6948504.1 ATP-binding protein [Nitrososphaerota archaeon]MDG6950430.1 ATP-binding protein [Nitrososphaerota archaeon]